MARTYQRVSSESPTLPLPPPRAEITLDQFFEAAASAALRALDAHAQLQPAGKPEPVPWRGHRIWVGIIAEPQLPEQLAGGTGQQVSRG